jgi:hypothetical protein
VDDVKVLILMSHSVFEPTDTNFKISGKVKLFEVIKFDIPEKAIKNQEFYIGKIISGN